QLRVSGTANLDGALLFTTVGGFAPDVGQRFPILTFAARTGDFATTSDRRLPGGRFFPQEFGPGRPRLVVNPPPALTIDDVTLTEADSGTVAATFTVTLSKATPWVVAVDFATVDGTATTADNDYVAATGTLSLAPEETTRTITVTVNSDAKYEPDET